MSKLVPLLRHLFTAPQRAILRSLITSFSVVPNLRLLTFAKKDYMSSFYPLPPPTLDCSALSILDTPALFLLSF